MQNNMAYRVLCPVCFKHNYHRGKRQDLDLQNYIKTFGILIFFTGILLKLIVVY